MRIRTQSGGILNPPSEYSGIDSTVITTDEGDPIVIAVNIEGAVCVATINDANFGDYMKMLGYKASDLPRVNTVEV